MAVDISKRLKLPRALRSLRVVIPIFIFFFAVYYFLIALNASRLPMRPTEKHIEIFTEPIARKSSFHVQPLEVVEVARQQEQLQLPLTHPWEPQPQPQPQPEQQQQQPPQPDRVIKASTDSLCHVEENAAKCLGDDTVLLIICANRPEYLRRTLDAVLKYHPR